MSDEDIQPGNLVEVTSKNNFKGNQLAYVTKKCKGIEGWEVMLINPVNPDSKYFCIAPEWGDTIRKIPVKKKEK